MDLLDGLTEPNGGAFTKTETRNGPPLDYVVEKTRSCIEALHSLNQVVDQALSENSAASKSDQIQIFSHAAFRYSVTSFLALRNLLALAEDTELFERLLKMDDDRLKHWLDDIDREGSVT